MLRRNQIFRDRTHPSDTGIQWWIHFPEIQIQPRRHSWPIPSTLKGLLRPAAVGPVPYLELTPLFHVLVTVRHFSSSGTFQEVWVELIEMVQDRPVQSLPSISNLLWGVFRISMVFQEIKIAEKKLKKKSLRTSMQQTTASSRYNAAS